MICVHCDNFDQLDQAWKMLTHVPDADFVPVALYERGAYRYTVIRSYGEQTTIQTEDLPACTNPAP